MRQSDDGTDLRPALLASIALNDAKDPGPAPFAEYADPADEIRQALTVLMLETEALGPGEPRFADERARMTAIREALLRIENVCKRGIAWRSGAPPTPATPKIYVFSNVVGGGEGICYAMAEDGHVLGAHWCSHECYAPLDLGMTGHRPDRIKAYSDHYPRGYELVLVSAADVAAHPGIARAMARNQALRTSEEPK